LHSTDDAEEFSPNTTFNSVLEGGQLELTADLVESVFGRKLLQPDIRFRAAVDQPHGRLSFVDGASPSDDADEIRFSATDLFRSRILYAHDGSETVSGRIRLYIEKQTSNEEEVVIPLNIIPVNDAPSVHLPPNESLTLVSNTRIRLSSELLSADDPDDVSSDLQFGVYPAEGADKDSGYFELAASSEVRAKISRFTQRDVEAGRVFYVHRGTATHRLLLDVTDGKDVSEIRRLTVIGNHYYHQTSG